MSWPNRGNQRRPQEIEDLLGQNSALVARVARTYTRRPEDCEDLIQEIRYQIVRSFSSWDPARTISTWMYRIALNTALTWRRKAARWQPVDVDWEAIPAPATGSSDPAQALLQQLMSRLSPFDRALLLLHFDELSHAEIGDVLGISPANVATKLSRIRQTLRNLAQTELTSQESELHGTR